MTDLGIKNLIIEGHSLVVVYTIQHRRLPLDWQIGPIIQNIHSLLSKTFSWLAGKINCNANFVAHNLVKWLLPSTFWKHSHRASS